MFDCDEKGMERAVLWIDGTVNAVLLKMNENESG